MEVSIMFYICRYCVFTWGGRDMAMETFLHKVHGDWNLIVLYLNFCVIQQRYHVKFELGT